MLLRRLFLVGCVLLIGGSMSFADEAKQVRVGIIGLDTSHATAFTKLLNDKDAPPELANCRVVARTDKGDRSI